MHLTRLGMAVVEVALLWASFAFAEFVIRPRFAWRDWLFAMVMAAAVFIPTALDPRGRLRLPLKRALAYQVSGLLILTAWVLARRPLAIASAVGTTVYLVWYRLSGRSL